jgi:hypothetical protein
MTRPTPEPAAQQIAAAAKLTAGPGAPSRVGQMACSGHPVKAKGVGLRARVPRDPLGIPTEATLAGERDSGVTGKETP